MLSATCTNRERHPACARSYFIVRKEFFEDNRPNDENIARENNFVVAMERSPSLKAEVLKKCILI